MCETDSRRAEAYILKEKAWKILKGNWLNAFFICLAYHIIIGLTFVILYFSPVIGIAVFLLTFGPFMVGLTSYFVKLARNEKPDFLTFFCGYRYFISSAILLPVIYAKIIFGLLLVKPGIAAQSNYSMALYILYDNSGLKPFEALALSRKVMKNNGERLWALYSQFNQWVILSVLTLGIVSLWYSPFMHTAEASFYLQLKEENSKA